MPPRRSRRVPRDATPEPQPAPAQGTINSVEVAAIVAQAVNAALAVVQQAPPQAPIAAPVQAHAFPSSWECVSDAFQKAHPSDFTGRSDVGVSSQWKKDIQRRLRMYECTDVQRHILATFKLVGSALQWWESITTTEERDVLSIQEFWVRFDRKYFPSAVHTKMRRKLINLKQEGKTVE